MFTRVRRVLPLPPHQPSGYGGDTYESVRASTRIRHVIELRIVPTLYPLWDAVIRTTLDYSGIRLRNAVRR